MEWAKMGLAKRIGVDLQEATRVYNQFESNTKEPISNILQPILSNGQLRTLGHSFNTNIQPKMNALIDWLQPLIDNFEAQSGSGDEP